MKGLKTREKRALAKEAAHVAASKKPGNMTSKILSFSGSSGRKSDDLLDQNVLSYDEAAKSRRVNRTNKGLFSYHSAT